MRRRAAAGMTLVELMVALTIGMLLSLAVFGIMATAEGGRRTLGSSAELEQAGAMAMFQLDRWVRSAGTGLAEAGAYAYGCPLHAAKSGSRILPRQSALPAPFAGVDPGSSVFRLAPALILPGQTTPGSSGQASDVLVLMSAAAANGNVPASFSAAAAAAQLTLVSTMAFSAGDLVLLADRQPATDGSLSACLLTQAATSATGGAGTTLGLAGTWYAASVGSASVAAYSETGVALALGNAAARLPPAFQLLGVGDNNTLYSYDLLQTSDTPLRARAESVFELHALYGVDSDADGRLDRWAPAGSGDYALAALSAGTPAAAALLKSIKALRVGLILRTALPEKDLVNAATTLTLFSDLDASLVLTRPLSAAEQHFRYRTVEATIPLRNNAL